MYAASGRLRIYSSYHDSQSCLNHVFIKCNKIMLVICYAVFCASWLHGLLLCCALAVFCRKIYFMAR